MTIMKRLVLALLLLVPAAMVCAGGSTDTGAATTAGELLEISVAKTEHPAQPIKPDAPAHLVINEKFNVKLNFIVMPSDDYTAKLKIWLATNQVPDLASGGTAEAREFADSGAILPYTPLVEKYAPNIKRYLADTPDIRKLTVNGEFYFVPTQYFNRKVVSTYPMIRMDVLKDLKLAEPKSWDELYEVLKAFKKAYPGNLIWANRNGTARLLSQTAYPMGSGFGIYWDKDVEGGKWLYGPVNKEFEYVLTYYARAYAEGLLDPDFAVTTADQWHEKNSSGKALWCYENMTFGVRWNLALRDLDPKYTWAPLGTFQGLKGRRMQTYGGLMGGYFIGSSTKSPERVIKILDWMMSPEGLDTTNWGIEGTHYRYKAGMSRPKTLTNYTIANLNKELSRENKEIIPSVWEFYAKKTDPFRTYQSDIGGGLLDFVMLTDSGMEYPWDPPGETDDWYKLTASDPGLHAPTLEPSFTSEETEKIKRYRTDVENILTPAFDKMIIGRMTIDEYRAEVEKAVKAGALELEKIYNAAEARMK